jgi:heme-degrading monooxygenase HmoA
MVLERLVANDLPAQTWVVSFANERMPDDDGYPEMAERMDALASEQPGYIGIDSVRGADGVGITVSRWSSIAAMVSWRRLGAHADAQARGRSDWYRSYRSDVARVDRSAAFARQQP